MIRCPKCGTLNRDINRFCNECGAPLDKTRIRCPKCGTLNPVGNVFCDHCHSRLMPAAQDTSTVSDDKPGDDMPPRLQGISLPTRAAPADESDVESKDQELPDWLVGFLELESAESGESGTESSAPLLPDWLSVNSEEDVLGGQALAPADLPDWLAALKQDGVTAKPLQSEEASVGGLPERVADLKPPSSTAAEPGPEAAPAEELPDWLAGAMEPSEFAAEPEPETVSAEGLPDWLADLKQTSVTAAEPEPETAPAEELPDWLADLKQTSVTAAEPEPEAAPAEELPDWLADLKQVSTSADGPLDGTSDLTSREAGELPDWFAGFGAAPIASDNALSAAAPGEGTDALVPAAHEAYPAGGVETSIQAPETDWDGKSGSAELGESAPRGESAETEDQVSKAIPDWLSALSPLAEAAPAETLPEDLEQAEVPTWLEAYRPAGTGTPEIDQTAGMSAGTEGLREELARAEIPDWVQPYHPTEESEKDGVSMLEAALPSTAEGEGPLLGLAGLLPASAAIEVSERLGVDVAQEFPQNVVMGAQLWQRLLEREVGGERAIPRTRRRATWLSGIMRVLFAVMLVLASVLRFSETPLAQPPEQPGIPALIGTIEALSANAEVLVAFEYSPAEVDEMQFIVEVLLEHLLSRGARVVGLSTLPEGPGLIQERFDWAAIRPDVPADNLVNLGFVAGGTSGVASVLADLGPTIDPDLLVVITSRPERLRAWVEQTAVLNEARAVAGRSPLPLVVGVSAAATPEVRPYLEASAKAGWLSGFSGVAAYWAARGLPPREDISRRLDALALTQWLVASLLLAGMLYYAVAGKKRMVK